MKTVRWLAATALLAFMISLCAFAPSPAAAADKDTLIREWQVQWIGKSAASDSRPSVSGVWKNASENDTQTDIPKGSIGMWVHFTMPPTSGWSHPSLLIDRLYGHNLAVYDNQELLYESTRDFEFDLNKLIVPLKQESVQADYYIRITTTSNRAGLISGIRIGEYPDLSNRFVSKDLPDLLFGTGIASLALIMFVCSGYLNQRQRGSWISLCLIAFSTGTLIITYSPLPYIYYKHYGNFMLLLFDISLFVLFPALNTYMHYVFDGKFPLFTKFARFQLGYSVFCFLVLVLYKLIGEQLRFFYDLFTIMLLGVIILAQLLLIIILSIRHAIKGNKESLILSVGILLLSLTGTADLILYYISDYRYILFLWKFGIAIMIIVLVIILARRIASDHAMLLTYSKELELYNHSLQRTEKMKIISDLAASVAHEVRNPLQVTRGFLQLLAQRAEAKSTHYFDMAINELDRASGIITDFLTFAKPELETIVILNLAEEMKKIEVMMTPLTAMHGGLLVVHIPEGLYIRGNASKFKQAFINMIKNSIEALQADGIIEIEAHEDRGEVIIQIKDNGEGMDEEEMAKLGVPFFSTKTKGTGLGTMVTFRIIEIMQGTIEFRSVKGKGTEVIIRFPVASYDENLPDALHA